MSALSQKVLQSRHVIEAITAARMHGYHGVLKDALLSPYAAPVTRSGQPAGSLYQKILPQGVNLHFPLLDGLVFPMLVDRPVYPNAAFSEIRWMLSGETTLASALSQGFKFWAPWAKDGEFGPIYGHQWRNFHGHGDFRGADQILTLVRGLSEGPYDRRHVVSAWNPNHLKEMALPPCHFSFQAFCTPPSFVHADTDEVIERARYILEGKRGDEGKISVDKDFWDALYHALEGMKEKDTLHLHVFIRSWDLFVGAPYNIMGYAYLCLLLARSLQKVAGSVTFHASHAHLYSNHLDLAEYMLSGWSDSSPAPSLRMALSEKDQAALSRFDDKEPHHKLLCLAASHRQEKLVPHFVPGYNEEQKGAYRNVPIFV